MPVITYTLEQAWEISDKCVKTDDRRTLGELAETVAEDGNLYNAIELERIERKIESEFIKLN